MAKRTKGVTAFSIVFVVYSITTFIGSLQTLISYLINITNPETTNLIGMASASPTKIEWMATGAALLGSAALFLAAMSILHNRQGALKETKIASILFIISSFFTITYQITTIGQPAIGFEMMSQPLAISWNVFEILFWTYVIGFFTEKHVKAQLR